MGNYLVYQINKFWLREEMRASIRSGNTSDRSLVIRIFRPETHPDLQRIDRQEFIYKGHLYDVVRETRKGDITTFQCIPDHKEELLVAGFKRVQNGKASLALRHHLITQALPISPASPQVARTACQVMFLQPIFPLWSANLELPGHPPELS